MMDNKVKILRGITRVAGEVEGEALVTIEKLSHLVNAVGSDGVIRMSGHPLMGQSYAGKIMVYDTDIFSTGGAWGLYFKSRITRTGPLALICRTVHPISVGGAVDARIPAVTAWLSILAGRSRRATLSGSGLPNPAGRPSSRFTRQRREAGLEMRSGAKTP